MNITLLLVQYVIEANYCSKIQQLSTKDTNLFHSIINFLLLIIVEFYYNTLASMTYCTSNNVIFISNLYSL